MGITPNTILQTTFRMFRREWEWIEYDRDQSSYRRAPNLRRPKHSTLQRYLRGCRLHAQYFNLQDMLENSGIRISLKDFDCIEPRTAP